MDWYSPLFRQASKAILDAAKAEFGRTMVGQLVAEVQRETSRAYRSPERLGQALRRYSRYGVKDALRDLGGTQFGQFAREIQRYSRQDSELKQLLKGFLTELGPAGKLIQALTGSEARGELDRLVKIMEAFGFEVLPRRADWKRGTAATERGLEAAQELLEAMGAKVVWPGDEPERRGTRLPFGLPLYDDQGRQRQRDPLADGRRPGPTLWDVASDRHRRDGQGPVVERPFLRLRHRRGVPLCPLLRLPAGTRGPDGHPLRGGPGSLYRYANVTPEEFLTLLAANSKGDWVWDHLRIRGTWSGHQKDYELVGVEGGYVPRKATVRRNPQNKQLEEWFVPRRVRAIGGGWDDQCAAVPGPPGRSLGRARSRKARHGASGRTGPRGTGSRMVIISAREELDG